MDSKTFFLFLVVVAVIAASGHAVGGPSGLALAMGVAVLSGIACWLFADRFLLRLYDARPAHYAEFPLIHRTLQRLSIRAHIPMPRLYVIPERAPNAFATGRNPEHASVAVTEGLTRLLNESEIEAVLAFAVARIARRDTLLSSVVAAAAGALGSVINFLMWGTLFAGARESGGVRRKRMAAAYQGLLAKLVRSHDLSLEADRNGAALTSNPLALASALEKMDAYSRMMGFFGGSRETGFLFVQNPFSSDMRAGGYRTHPRTRERVSQLWQMARKQHTAA